MKERSGTATKKSVSSSKRGSDAPARRGSGGVGTPRRREFTAAVFFILAVFSIIGYFNTDGAFIGFFVGFIKGLVGGGFFALAPVLLMCSVILCFHRGRPVLSRTICVLLLPVIIGSLIHLFACDPNGKISLDMFPKLWGDGKSLNSGGAVGGAFTELFYWLFDIAGAAVVLISAALFLLMTAFNITLTGIVDAIKKRERREYIPEPKPDPAPMPTPMQERLTRAQKRAVAAKKKSAIDIPIDGEQPPDNHPEPPKEKQDSAAKRVKALEQYLSGNTPSEEEEVKSDDPEEIEDIQLDIPFMEKKRKGKEPTITQPRAREKTSEAPEKVSIGKKQAEDFEQIKTGQETNYSFPPVELLSAGVERARSGDDEVRVNSDRLEAAFRSFGVNVTISTATRGPAVTRYEAELEAGIKLSRLTSLADDIALSLGTSGVRIAAMPNKISTVGIEVPNKNISKVYLRSIIESQAFTNAKSKLTFAIGMDISGEAIVGNVSKLPHMLVAGTTGSGKSVCLNSFILSILYKATPDDARFIMIDPKMVEFKVYNNIPHLLVPVVTDIKKAAGALQWAVFEMMKRYALFAETNARDIEGYNQIARGTGEREPLPQIIVVIDELADLMMMAAKEVEESVCRVAQMGRAAGMHLIIATQSPRADVITGLMKANIPSRIAFKVSSALESRIILDAGGNADKLVGNGDMLFAPIGTNKPMRVQGTWVSDKERETVVDFIKKSGETQYSEEVMDEIEKAAVDRSPGDKIKDEPEGADYDELLPQAVDVIFETGQASVSMLQRRLKLGYSRAARIVDQMEQMGIVGPFEGSKPRTVLVTKDQWRQMQYVNGTAPVDKAYPYPIAATSFDEPDDEDDEV
ncbi:MAG: DNA translocase FtsK [Oscillospiraceae bacterium]|nr:DNA translocase FtsK [Oscillospiraceae bacterium]